MQDAQESTSRCALLHLRAWRTRKGYSQQELAHLASTSKATIVYLEAVRARANYVTVGKLAGALGITREQLLGYPPTIQR